MSEILKAREELKSSNFKKALEKFKLILESAELENSEREECCKAIISIYHFLSKEISHSDLLLLAENWASCKNYYEASDYFFSAYKKSKNLNFLNEAFKNILLTGDLEKAKKYSKEYLEKSYRRGFSKRISLFLSESENFLGESEIHEWRVKSFIACGDITSLEEILDDVDEYLKDFIVNELSNNTRYWHSSHKILNWVLRYFDSCGKTISKKQLVKTLLDAWLILEKDYELINTTLSLSKKYRLNILGHELAKTLGKTDEMDYFSNRCNPDMLNLDSLDLGLDLLSSDTFTDGSKQLEKNIKFLVKSGLRDEALKQLKKLEKVDPDNELVKLFNKQSDEESLEQTGSITELIDEISKYTKDSFKGGSNEASLDSFSTLAKFYDQKTIEENYEDMIIGFNLLNLPDVALEILKRVEVDSLEMREKVNILYLKTESLLKLERYYEVRDVVDDAVSNLPLNDDELLALIYVRAESYFLLRDKQNALADYYYIESKSKKYRLTAERIRELEKDE